MAKIEIRPSDKVLYGTSCYIRNKEKEALEKENPEYLKRFVNRNLVELLINNILDKQVIKEIPLRDIDTTEYRTEFYVFTPEEMRQFIQEVEEKVLRFAGKSYAIGK